jgi:hypothetical protein
MHLEEARLCALDLKFAQVTSHQQQLPPHGDTGQGPAGSSHSPRKYVLALLQFFVPWACIISDYHRSLRDLACSDTVYIVEVPQQQEQAAELMSLLQPLLQDAAVVKVMHDARCGSSGLLQQFGIQLGGVLDTQVLAGMATLAAAVPNSSSTISSGELDGASSSQAARSSAAAGNGSCSGLSNMDRVGLGKLYHAYGCPHPRKHTVGESFDQDPR